MTAGDERVPEMDLPGAWSYSDFEGGPPDEVRGPDWTPPGSNALEPPQSIVFGLCPACENWMVEAPLDTDPEMIEEAIIEHDAEDHPGKLAELAEHTRRFQQRLLDLARASSGNERPA